MIASTPTIESIKHDVLNHGQQELQLLFQDQEPGLFVWMGYFAQALKAAGTTFTVVEPDGTTRIEDQDGIARLVVTRRVDRMDDDGRIILKNRS